MSTLNGGPGNIVTNGLVLYLDAANYLSYTSGSTVWRDLSSSNNSGSLENNPGYNGANGGSIVFDGTDDYIKITSSVILNEPKTMEAWVYITSQQSKMILSRNTDNYEMYTFTDGFMYTYWGGAFNTSVNNPPITLNAWNYFVFTLSGTTETVYKNGALVGTRTLNASPVYTNTGDLNIGRRNTGTNYLDGRISITRLYNRALSPSEILQNYNATKARFGL
jgi:hypothetical protein